MKKGAHRPLSTGGGESCDMLSFTGHGQHIPELSAAVVTCTRASQRGQQALHQAGLTGLCGLQSIQEEKEKRGCWSSGEGGVEDGAGCTRPR